MRAKLILGPLREVFLIRPKKKRSVFEQNFKKHKKEDGTHSSPFNIIMNYKS